MKTSQFFLLLNSCILFSGSALIAMSADQADLLLRDVAIIKQGVQQLLSQPGGGGGGSGGAAAAPGAAKPAKTPGQLAQELPEMISSASRNATIKAQLPDHIAALIRAGADLSYSRSSGSLEDTALYKAILKAMPDVQKLLWDAGARLTPFELVKLQGWKTDGSPLLNSVIKEITDSLN